MPDKLGNKSREEMGWQYQDIPWQKLLGFGAQMLPGAGLATGSKTMGQGMQDLMAGKIAQGLSGLAGGAADVGGEFMGPAGKGAAMAGTMAADAGQKAMLRYLQGTVPPYSAQWIAYEKALKELEEAGTEAAMKVTK